MRIADNGEVEVEVSTEGLPLAKFGHIITIVFRPRQVTLVVDEIRGRVDAVQRA